MKKPIQHPINLLRGWPHPSLLPTALLASSSQAVLSNPAVYEVALQYGADPGFQPLREAIATWLHAHYSVERDPERICISGGASQNIACILQSFSDPAVTRAVWLVAPTYHLVGAIFDDAGFSGRLRAFPEDKDGPDVAALEDRIRRFEEEDEAAGARACVKDPGPYRKLYRHIIYIVPTCANPSGKTMSLKRREDFVRLARRHDALVICDDVYDLLQWPVAAGHPASSARVEADASPEMTLPRLCDIDLAMAPSPDDPARFGYAVSNGSFSKMAGPGMRTGWLEGSRAFALGLAQTGSTKSGGSPSQFSAAVVADMVASGALQGYLAGTVRPALQRRHGAMVEAVRRHLEPLGVRFRLSGLVDGLVYGGYFVWLGLPEGLSSAAVVEVAMAENLIVGSGSMFQVHGDEGSVDLDGFLRLTFSYVPEEDLVEGVVRLARALVRLQENPDGYRGVANGALAAAIVESSR